MSKNLTVDSISDATSKIRVISFRSADSTPLPSYTAGAHIDIELEDIGARSYSLIDWPDQSDPARYLIAVQRKDDGTGGSKAMHKLSVGQQVKVSDPLNDFELSVAANSLLVAGGIGVTPMISMATALAKVGADFEFHYAARSADVMAFKDDLQTHFQTIMMFHFDDDIPMDLAALMAAQSAGAHVYLCGPKGMIDAARAAAHSAGIPDDQIHIELFESPDAMSNDTSFEVEIQDTGTVYTIPPGKTIIEVLEAEGVDLMYDCQRGDCGICQTDVVSGTPDHRDVVLSEADRASGKVIQICVSRAKSDRLVLDL